MLGEVGGKVYGSARFLQIFREFEIIKNKEMPIAVDSVIPLFCRKQPAGASTGNPSVA